MTDNRSNDEQWLYGKLAAIPRPQARSSRRGQLYVAVLATVVAVAAVTSVAVLLLSPHSPITPLQPIAVSASPTPVADTPTCQPSSLALSQTTPNGGAGSVFVWNILTNSGSTTCYLSGIPNITERRVTPVGLPFHSNELRATALFPVAKLAPGGTATFLEQIGDCGPPVGYTVPPKPAGDYGTATTSIQIPGTAFALSSTDGQDTICGSLTFTVWPIQNGFETIPGTQLTSAGPTGPTGSRQLSHPVRTTVTSVS